MRIAAGTAAMGKVVDTRLRVKGVRGLRVADASIFPTAMGGHPQTTFTLLISYCKIRKTIG